MRSESARKAETSTNADKRFGVDREVERHMRVRFDVKPFGRMTCGSNERGSHRGGDDAFDDFVADRKVLYLRKSTLDGGELTRDRTAVLGGRGGGGVFDVLNKKGG